MENRKSLALTDVRVPSHPDSSESLYCLRYPGSNSEDGGSTFIRNVDNQYESTRSCNNRDDRNKIFTALKTSSLNPFPYIIRQNNNNNNNNNNNGLCAAISCSILTHS